MTAHTSATTSHVSTQGFQHAERVHQALTASAERRALQWLAVHAPRWLTSDQLTTLGLLAQIAAGASYLLARFYRPALLIVCVCIALNWLGDSLDGTLARVRKQPRPRFGFYVDHIVDMLGATAMIGGLALSNLMHGYIAAALLIAFLLLSAESYLTTYTLGCFELSQGPFGPTELRLLLIVGNLALLRSPYATLLHHRVLLFDVGGSLGAAGMFALVIALAARHTLQLYKAEPLPTTVESGSARSSEE